jgi:hypothetical protein
MSRETNAPRARMVDDRRAEMLCMLGAGELVAASWSRRHQWRRRVASAATPYGAERIWCGPAQARHDSSRLS